MTKKRTLLSIISILLICVMMLNLTGCNQVQAEDLMAGIEANEVNEKTADDTFINSQMNLSVELFKTMTAESEDPNVLISPLSIQLALAMTANGAKGDTKTEMETLLGGEISLEELNEYLYTYVNNLPSEEDYKLEIANSIWFRDEENRLTVEESFLQTNADYYGAQAYKSAFDDQTVEDINNWVDQHTDGMIDEIIDVIPYEAVMYLINALVFDAEWQNVYNAEDIHDGTFTSLSGEERTVSMMHSEEYTYLDDGDATGFIKSYKDGRYCFVALLPNEDVDIYEYIRGLTGEELLNTLNNRQSSSVLVTMPKFSYEYELEMKGVLKALGMPTAFDRDTADFSALGQSTQGNLYITSVLHKTFISVDELGTKAGAVTMVEMSDECAPLYELKVVLDRPFVYMIIDNETNLPIFMGTVTDLH